MNTVSPHRDLWIDFAVKLATPVLANLENLPIVPISADREKCTHLEALARTLAGIAPYIEAYANKEAPATKLLSLASYALHKFPWGENIHPQNIIDLGYLSQAFLRSPTLRWAANRVFTDICRHAEEVTKHYRPLYNNWLVMRAMMDLSFQPHQGSNIDFALKQCEQWYVGDSFYKDGPNFQFDYYQSYVFHPCLYDIATWVHPDPTWEIIGERIKARAARYALIQERLISPEGTFPQFGRSASYRLGAFHSLAHACYREYLPEIYPSQVRCALTAVLKNMAPHMFDKEGWLVPGFNAPTQDHALLEPYITTGSCYMTSLFLLPLGLPKESAFWSGEDKPWTQKRLWNGGLAYRDCALKTDPKPLD